METVLDFGVPTTAQGHIKRIWNYGHPLLSEALDDTIKVREHFFSCEALDDMIKCWFQKVNTLSSVVFYDITNASGNFIK